MHRWLVLKMEAPLVAFGGVAIDHMGAVHEFPAASMIAGLIGNALGWHWSDSSAHQAVQDRLVFGTRIEREGRMLTDTQNAQLAKNDKGWTTSGQPEGREGGTYGSPHRRFRQYHADASVRVVFRLELAAEKPTLDRLAEALERPARPLYLGRKACLPSSFLLEPELRRWSSGSSVYEALQSLPGASIPLRAQWPVGQGPETGEGVDQVADLADMRNWRTGLHAGSRRVVQGWVEPVKER